MKKKVFCLFSSVLLAASLCACGGGGAESGQEADASLTQIDVVLDWYPNAIHTFLYEAAENGYFEEEGLKVYLISPAESIDAITFVASGRAQIGLTYPVEVIQAASDGMPVEAIAAVSQKPLDCLCSLEENTGVTADMSSLKGKKVGYSGTSVSEATVRTITKNAGLADTDYELVNVGFDLVTALTTKSVDLAAGIFINDEVPTMQNAGYAVNVFSEQDYGVPDLYGLVMAVNSDAYEKNPEIYEGFLRACRKGFEDMKADEDAALELIMEKMNSADNPLDETQQRQSYEILMDRMETKDGAFLSMKEETWQSIIDWMTASGLIEKEVTVGEILAAGSGA